MLASNDDFNFCIFEFGIIFVLFRLTIAKVTPALGSHSVTCQVVQLMHCYSGYTAINTDPKPDH